MDSIPQKTTGWFRVFLEFVTKITVFYLHVKWRSFGYMNLKQKIVRKNNNLWFVDRSIRGLYHLLKILGRKKGKMAKYRRRYRKIYELLVKIRCYNKTVFSGSHFRNIKYNNSVYRYFLFLSINK